MKSRSLLGAAACIGAMTSGCGGTTPAAGSPLEPSATPPQHSPTPSASANASASATPEAPAPTQPAKSPFHVLVRSDATLELFPLGDRLFVRGGNIPLALVEGDRVVEDEKYGRGLEGFIGFTGLAGRWSDDAWAVIILTNGRVGWGGVRKWDGKGWAPSGTDLSERWIYAGLSRWANDQMLALAFNGMPYDTNEPMRFSVVGKTKRGKVPVFTKAACGTLVRAQAFAALPSGEVFAAGAACDDEKLAVEWWAPGETKGTVQRLGVEDPQADVLLLGSSPKSVWLMALGRAKSTLARFDGKSFQFVSPPSTTPIASASVAPDDTLWLVMGDASKKEPYHLWKRQSDGRAEVVPLPEGFTSASQVHAAANGVVWLAAETSLLRNTPPKGEPQQLAWQPNQQFPSGVRIPKLASEGCNSIFVMMYGITKVTPKDYDFPLTRKAVKGHKELAGARFAETEDNGKRYFGAFVPTLEMGKKLEKLVKDNVKGSKPAVLCNSPKVIREVPIDLATGEVVK